MSRPKGSRNHQTNYYAVYRGDEFLAHGDVWELSWLFNVKPNSIRCLATPYYQNRAYTAENPDKWLIVIKVDELTTKDLNITHRKRG
jgi:hypothetical protein